MTDRRNYAEGTYLEVQPPWNTYVGGKARCSDGTLRQLKAINPEADTVFSIPASVRVKGKTVTGFVTFATVSGSEVATDDDPLVLRFHAHHYGRNHELLPPSIKEWMKERGEHA